MSHLIHRPFWCRTILYELRFTAILFFYDKNVGWFNNYGLANFILISHVKDFLTSKAIKVKFNKNILKTKKKKKKQFQ